MLRVFEVKEINRMGLHMTVRAPWTNCIVSTVFAAVCFYIVLKSGQKAFLVGGTMLGTILLLQAIRECPIRLARLSSFAIGTLALTTFGVLAGSGLGYYHHKLKIIIMVSLCAAAAYFFWEHFSRRQSLPESS
jgi:hypothetical protein